MMRTTLIEGDDDDDDDVTEVVQIKRLLKLVKKGFSFKYQGMLRRLCFMSSSGSQTKILRKKGKTLKPEGIACNGNSALMREIFQYIPYS